MWAMIAMNWVIATLIMAVVVLWIITQLRIWRSGEVSDVQTRASGKGTRTPIWGRRLNRDLLTKEIDWELSWTVS
jgi:hypothetical protein